jgi:hypothetical protein
METAEIASRWRYASDARARLGVRAGLVLIWTMAAVLLACRA